MDMNEHAVGINIRNLKSCPFADSQAQGIDDFQTGAMMRELNTIEYVFHFIPAQDDRQFLFLFRADEFQGCPFPFQRECIEILDAAKRNRGSCSGPFAFVLVKEKILAEFFVGNFFWRFLIMFCKLLHSPCIHLDCFCA